MSSFTIPPHLLLHSPHPAFVSLYTARHRQLHLWRPPIAPLFATNFSARTQHYDHLSAANSEELELHTELHGQETSFDGSDYEEEEEVEEEDNFDSEQLELEAIQAVKEFSDSLSRESKIG